MAFLNLIVLNSPNDLWAIILNAFNSAMGSYIFAVILLAVILRIIFSIVDIFNKRINLKNSQINEKMKPELEAVQKKYGHDRVLLQKKQSEIYQKYQFSMVGSCLPMVILMLLQSVVFITLATSLQSISNYNIATQYENTKSVYASIVKLNENDEFIAFLDENTQGLTYGTGYTLEAVDIDLENNKMTIQILGSEKNLIDSMEVQTYTTLNSKEGEENYLSNQDIFNNLIKQYVDPEVDLGDDAVVTALSTTSDIVSSFASETAAEYFKDNMESFLWIKNIYKAETPTTDPKFTESEITSILSSYYSDEESALEETYGYESIIYSFVTKDFNEIDMGVNGYYILVIIAVCFSVLSIFLSNQLMKKKNKDGEKTKTPGGKAMYIIMPIIIGIFTLMYTSLFAIYVIMGQIISVCLTPLNNFIVKKWLEKSEKKKKEKDVIDVDYRRKDI